MIDNPTKITQARRTFPTPTKTGATETDADAGTGPVAADRWFATGDGSWIAVDPTAVEDTWFDRLEQLRRFDRLYGARLPDPRVRAIDNVPATGCLRYAVLRAGRNADLLVREEVTVPTPGQVTVTAEDVRSWTGRVLTPEQVQRLPALIGASAIPVTLTAVLATAFPAAFSDRLG